MFHFIADKICSTPRKKPYARFLVCFCLFGFSLGSSVPSLAQLPQIKWPFLKDANLTADLETTPMPHAQTFDYAEDPAIWVHPIDVEKSLIFATNKRRGIAVYDLNGKELHFLEEGDINNIDLRHGFNLRGQEIDLLAGSHQSKNRIDIWEILPEKPYLRSITSGKLKSDLDEVYGLCMYKSPVSGDFFVFVNDKEGDIEQWRLSPEFEGVTGSVVRKLEVGDKVEGMAADDEYGTLFVSEEQHGIWRFNAEPDDYDRGYLLPLSGKNNPNFTFDIEGLTIYSASKGQGYLIASIQGNNSFALFERTGGHRYIGSFRLQGNEQIDGVQETDGIDVTPVAMGRFNEGFFIALDGYNYDGQTKKNQNFKLVSWGKIARLAEPPLVIEPRKRRRE